MLMNASEGFLPTRGTVPVDRHSGPRSRVGQDTGGAPRRAYVRSGVV